MDYICPVCKKHIEREASVFITHVEKHIAEEIKKSHPELAEKDGICKRCLEYYRDMMKGKYRGERG